MTLSTSSWLDTYLQLCSEADFNGVFTISNRAGTSWKLRFLSGRFVADAGGMFPLQRWQRQVIRYCSTNPLEQYRYPDSLEWNSQVLNELIVRNIISRQVAIKILGNSVSEILFEVALQELKQGRKTSVNSYQMNWQSLSNTEDVPRISIDINKIWPKIIKLVSKWDQSGWINISPSSVPAVLNHNLLRQLSCDADFAQLAPLLDGRSTLWELAAQQKCSIYSITQTIVSLEQQQCVKFTGF